MIIKNWEKISDKVYEVYIYEDNYMRRYLKKEINNILETLLEANDILKKYMMANQSAQVRILSDDLSESVEQVLACILYDESASEKLANCLMAYKVKLEECWRCKTTTDKISACMILKKYLEQAQNVLINEVKDDKFKITFMPYKADMWNSMASIYCTALSDEDCDVSVVPIPYYNITNPENISFCYEAGRFPKDVTCVHYDKYCEQEEYPDVIIIHNPYDEENNLTRVPERFYSANLINSTAKLVYAPYFTMSYYREEKHSWMLASPANLNADLILAQSERVKNIYLDMGYPDEKILAFGSPKIDSVVSMASKSKEDIWEEIPVEWKEKIQNKKIFLLNTHLSYFPNCSQNKARLGNYAVQRHDEILKELLNRDDCGLIWRPHPLMKTMISGRFPEWLDYIEEMERKIKSSSNGIIDELGDYTYSFVLSDALITTYSTLINEYLVSQKPILLIQTKLSEEDARMAPVNINVSYGRIGAGKISVAQFRDNVIAGRDPQKQERLDEVRAAFPNLDGKAGERIYYYLKEN